MPRDALTREQPRPMLIEHPNPHALMALVRDRGLVVMAPIERLATGQYGVIVEQTRRPVRVRPRLTDPLWIVGGAVIALGAAAVAVGWWATHGLPLLCSLFVAGAVTLILALHRLAKRT